MSITEFKSGWWYRYTNPNKTRPSTWNHQGEMDFMLDGNWHKCDTPSFAHRASFFDSPDKDHTWSWGTGIDFMEESEHKPKEGNTMEVTYEKERDYWYKVENGTKIKLAACIVCETVVENKKNESVLWLDQNIKCCKRADHYHNVNGALGIIDAYVKKQQEQQYKSKTKTEVKTMELKNIKRLNLAEAKTQYMKEKQNAEVEYAKEQFLRATNAIDAIDRKRKELNEDEKPHLEVLKLFTGKSS